MAGRATESIEVDREESASNRGRPDREGNDSLKVITGHFSSILRVLHDDRAANQAMQEEIRGLLCRVESLAKSEEAHRKEKREIIARLRQLDKAVKERHQGAVTRRGYPMAERASASRPAQGSTSLEMLIRETFGKDVDRERDQPMPPAVSLASTTTLTLVAPNSRGDTFNTPTLADSPPQEFKQSEQTTAIPPAPVPVLRNIINIPVVEEARTKKMPSQIIPNQPIHKIDPLIAFVRNLPPGTTSADIRGIFSSAGEMTTIKIREGSGTAFCQFADYDGLLKAVYRIHGNTFRGRTISVERARGTRIY